MRPPVPMVSSSGWAWTVMRVRRASGEATGRWYLRHADERFEGEDASMVIASIGSRLRVVLRQPGDVDLGVDGEDLPEVDFVAYAVSERLSGRVRLDNSRLSDMLNAHDEFVLVDALAERLPEGGSMVVSEILVRR